MHTRYSVERNRNIDCLAQLVFFPHLISLHFQEPKDYQESIRKSPGVPHDPDRQPSGGGVLKRNDTSKTASPVVRKPQRGATNGRLSRI